MAIIGYYALIPSLSRSCTIDSDMSIALALFEQVRKWMFLNYAFSFQVRPPRRRHQTSIPFHFHVRLYHQCIARVVAAHVMSPSVDVTTISVIIPACIKFYYVPVVQ